ncbi:MAG: lipoyl(octanoyl) transferase LipB [Anaerolineae bacterium]
MSESLAVVELGRQAYGPMEVLQHEQVDWRQSGLIGDTLLLLEHEPVITLGRRAKAEHVLAPEDLLAREGIAVHQTERGGDVTYHGPGQLVGYPIVHLPSLGLGASDYMHRLEDVIAAALADFGLRTHRREGVIGVWVGQNKIAALGVRIRRGVAFHGLALNVAPNMRHWSYIIPCGITDGGVTSLALELGDAPPLAEACTRLVAHMGAAFSLEPVPTTLAALRQRAESAGAGTLSTGVTDA